MFCASHAVRGGFLDGGLQALGLIKRPLVGSFRLIAGRLRLEEEGLVYRGACFQRCDSGERGQYRRRQRDLLEEVPALTLQLVVDGLVKFVGINVKFFRHGTSRVGQPS